MRLTSKALVLMVATTAFCICHIKYTPECKEEIKLYTKCYEPDREIFYSDECQEFLNNFFDILPKCKKSLPPSFRKCEESRHKAEYAELVLEINRSDEEYNRCPLNMEYGYSVDESDTERLERLLKAAKNSCYSKKCSKAALQYFELMKESKILEKAIDDKREELYDNAIDTLNKCNNGNSGSSSGSSSGKCGKNIGSCPNGKCCSKYGYCGTTDDYCSDTKGCQSEFGVCFSIGEPAVFEYPVSKDGRCGENFGTRCPNDECCSQYGYCGESSKHCGKGCQSEFGDCYSVGEPAVDYPVSEDGRCGENFGTRCPNDECCSQYSYCGESSKHCGKGCQSEFGHCN